LGGIDHGHGREFGFEIADEEAEKAKDRGDVINSSKEA